ncbi:MAG TPA: protein kinase [Anaerolineae bacterium]|nr:protein kinase [Anaerolineae bacterium]
MSSYQHRSGYFLEACTIVQRFLKGTDDMDDLSGKEIRGYKLIERIGEGGFGVVYRAEQPAVDREVAIKVILPEYADHPEFVRRFEVEARMVAKLEHPHIVPLYDYWRDEEGAFLVMRWLRGGSLVDALKSGPLGVEAAGRLLEQLSEALNVAHKQGVVHRDLKPENILLDEEGNGYLTDFGIAKDLVEEGLTKTGEIVGSVFYLAPEQAKGEPVTPKTDIYGLGVVLYEMLVGEHPFPGLTPVQLIQKHLNQPLPSIRGPSPKMSKALNGLIQRATAKNPAERYVDVSMVMEAYRQALAIEGDMADESGLPSFLEGVEGEREVEYPVFVGREHELARLDEVLHKALRGHGQVVFVTGNAGNGKTALLQEFSKRAQEENGELLVASGSCNPHTGTGDPYLPFRDVLGMLTGDVEGRWSAGTITQDHARRLWNHLPATIEMLIDNGPDLVDLFIFGGDLEKRATAATLDKAPWMDRLRALVSRERATPGELEQTHLFDQYANVLCELASQRPLMILLDDLQWADTGSIDLIFHLSRRIEGARILIAGAYRPDEVALGRNGGRHPLEKMLTEMKRYFGDIWIDLGEMDEAEDRDFVDAFLDTEPNRLDEGFRQALYRHTSGHPLFTIELLRAMQERGDLILDKQGRWVEGPALDWGTLPARVEGVIEERVGRLETELREILSVASVEGEDFTAQVIARVQEIGERKLLRELSQELEKRHRLVRVGSEVRVGRYHLSRYQFAHTVIQRYLYNELSPGERRLLHREIASVLDELYEGRRDEIAVQLARHYTEAGEAEKAIENLLTAGDKARALHAHREAIDYYERALDFLREQKEYDRAARTLMKLGLTHHLAYNFESARHAYEEGFAFLQRAGEVIDEGLMEPAPHPLRVDHWIDPSTLDAVKAHDTYSMDVIAHLFSGLITVTPELDIVPEIAQRWEVLEGGRKYIFHLRDDFYWSDGHPVTAHDFVYTWKRVLDPALGSPSAQLLYSIKGARAFHKGEVTDPDCVGIRALNDMTLEFEHEDRVGYALHLLSVGFPVPRHIVEEHGEAWTELGNLVTNGPFRLEEWQPGRSMTLTRNPRYPGSFPGNVEQVELCLIADRSKKLQMYVDGALDIYGLWPHSIENDRARQGFAGEYLSYPETVTSYVGFDTSRPPFDDVRVRQAFALATDKVRLADETLRGFDFPALGGFVPPGLLGHTKEIKTSCDPKRAQDLLKEAGYPDGVGFPSVEFFFGGDCVRAPSLADQWYESLGVEIKCEHFEWSQYSKRLVEEPPHLFTMAWAADYPDPDNFMRTAHFQELTRWHNETYENLVEEARRVGDQEERMKMYHEAERILVDEVPIIPLTYIRWHILVKPWVKKVQIAGAFRSWYKEIVLEPH